ncbi:winged helix-turn-helix domain-containing protein [Thalassotalea sp. 1_MG-2023]|uniref:winged helix-turn-helix domain-containing protein n=1 Tax=Thalassotalea sp. 1_MG-2023 TaxID=3062680 RepID=UPI0026E2B33E|nr:winged helix-turn-helix domain-containing protein [Thalassotalea sp. 1_MG-2023]MDO6425658.1 winged helix-turn-helix domain-containing protein [Thalassotalea sp. 1_MG-2023]
MEKHHLIKIKNWIFDPSNKTLTFQESENNKQAKIETLESKHVALLSCLIEHQGSIVSREQLVKIVWKDRYVDDRTINATISRLRKILGGETQEFIKTHPKSGYSLHCVTSTILIKKVDQNLPNKPSSIPLQKKFTLTLIIFLSLLTVLYAIDQSQKPLETQTETNLEIIPLTYEEGWEFEPSLNADGNLLLYTALDEKKDVYIIKIQDLSSRKTFSIQESYDAKSPIWRDKNTIYYITYERNQCDIFSIKLNQDLTFSHKQYITSCGKVNYYTALAFSARDNSLYFTYKESNETSTYIKKINLSTNFEQRITTPLSTFKGDSYVRLNNNNSKLAFIRHNDDNSSSINILDLISGELHKINSLSSNIYAITWAHNSDILYYIDEMHRLMEYKLSSKQSVQIFKHRETITDPSSVSDAHLILSIGDIYDANILKFDTLTPNPKLKKVISSSFKDHTADSHTVGGHSKIIFVSNRSGKYQLWESSQNGLKQLSHFKSKETYIENILIAPNGQNLILKKDNSYAIFNIEKNSISQIKINNFNFSSAIWSCDKASNSIFIVGTSNNNWQLIEYNLNSKKHKMLTHGITSIKANCKSRIYAFSRQNQRGFFISTGQLNPKSTHHYFKNYSFHDQSSWTIADEKAYLLSTESDIVLELNYLDQTESNLHVTGANIHSVHFKDNTLFFNNLKPRNNYIGKVVLPNNKNTTNPQ